MQLLRPSPAFNLHPPLIHMHPILSICIHLNPPSSTFIHFCPPVSTWVNLRSHVSTSVHLRPTVCTCVYLHPLSSTFIHFHPSASTCVHQHPMHPTTSIFAHPRLVIWSSGHINVAFWQFLPMFRTFRLMATICNFLYLLEEKISALALKF